MKTSRFIYSILFTALATSFAIASTTTSADYNANNTGVNKRDTEASQLTAQDQNFAKQRVNITRSIRQSLVKDKSLSTDAQNVKIIVLKNEITLKGPVRNSREREVIEAKAHAAAPKLNIHDQTQIIQ